MAGAPPPPRGEDEEEEEEEDEEEEERGKKEENSVAAGVVVMECLNSKVDPSTPTYLNPMQLGIDCLEPRFVMTIMRDRRDRCKQRSTDHGI